MKFCCYRSLGSRCLLAFLALTVCWGRGSALSAASNSNQERSNLYDLDHLLEIRVTMDPSDFMRLRRQHPDRMAQMQGREANPEPYSMFKATVSVDGEEVANVGIRKKGNLGSVVSSRPSLKLDFNQFVDKQKFRGVKGLTLSSVRHES